MNKSIIILLLIFAVFSSCKQTENTPIERAEKLLIGNKPFGVQMIWDGYGDATIVKEKGVIKISGTQFSVDKKEFTKIDGTIKVITDTSFSFNGRIQIYTEECCGKIDKFGNFTFYKTGNRKFWRLRERDQLCDPYTCHYYMDIYERQTFSIMRTYFQRHYLPILN